MRLSAYPWGTIVELASGEVWDGARLGAETRRRRSRLARLGVRPGARVMIAHGATPAFFADLFATWELGAAAACINPLLTVTENRTLAAFIAPAAVLVGPDAPAERFAGIATPVVCLADGPESPESLTPELARSALDDPALILFTSGTTGDPKGVVHTFRSVLARVALNQAWIGAPALARTLCVLPTHFGHGLIGNCLTPLLAGGDLFVHGTLGVAGAARLGSVIDQHRITFLSSVPAFWKVALKAARPPATPTLARVHVGSAPLSAALWRQIMTWAGIDDVVNTYGITETANWVAGASARTHEPADGLVGTMWGGRAAVREEGGRLLATGEGEIALQTPALMSGYDQRPDLTDAVLRDGWFFTGDIGRIEPDGRLFLTGRAKDEINRAGIKVHPEEVDLLLERHPDVAEACAFALADDISGERVGVAVRLREGAAADAGALKSWCAERIRRESVPERWFLVPEIPRTERGKVNRRKVMERCLRS